MKVKDIKKVYGPFFLQKNTKYTYMTPYCGNLE